MFQPKYNLVVDSALNKEVNRTPLYEHNISYHIMEKLTNKKFGEPVNGNLDFFYENYCNFFPTFGYDTVTYEGCIVDILPGGGNLAGHVDPPAITCMEDLLKYPFEEIPKIYKEKYYPHFDMIKKHMPNGAKAIGGVGNGVFEIAEDLVGYENLMLLKYDDEEAYSLLFKKIGDMMSAIWTDFVKYYSDTYCVMRFGDDLGFKSNTLCSYDDIKEYIIPQYRKITDIVHSVNRPFLLHSCGCIFGVFDDIISKANINAKHSNEDQIAPFKKWVTDYGDRIGNFGGIDTDHLVRKPESEIRELVRNVWEFCHKGHGGFCLGSGNSIPDYVDVNKSYTMIDELRKIRGE